MRLSCKSNLSLEICPDTILVILSQQFYRKREVNGTFLESRREASQINFLFLSGAQKFPPITVKKYINIKKKQPSGKLHIFIRAFSVGVLRKVSLKIGNAKDEEVSSNACFKNSKGKVEQNGKKSKVTSNNDNWLVVFLPFCNMKNKLICIVYLLFVYMNRRQNEDEYTCYIILHMFCQSR